MNIKQRSENFRMNSQRFIWSGSRRVIAIIRGVGALLIIGAIVATILSQTMREKSTAQGSEEIGLPQPIVTATVIMRTSAGTLEIELYGRDAPKAVDNFLGLIAKDFYNGILFHRIVPGFVVQAGDPNTRDPSKRSEWGKGGTSIYGAPFEDELNVMTPSFKRGYVEGALCMANRGPNTNTSQFFIILKDNEKLEKRYTIFGKVSAGIDVVHKIELTGATAPVTIESITLKRP